MTAKADDMLRGRDADAVSPDPEQVRTLDTLLPQTQCGRCGYPGCASYATAMAAGEQSNRCPPGGEETARALAEALQRPYLSPDATRAQGFVAERVALIREEDCIGCTKCIQVCPTGAIVGAMHFSHTVLEQACTGCDLCLPPCPTDCIDLVPARQVVKKEDGRLRFTARERRRLAKLPATLKARPQVSVPKVRGNAGPSMTAIRRRKTVAALMRARRQNSPSVAELERALTQLDGAPSPARHTSSSPLRLSGERPKATGGFSQRAGTDDWRQPPPIDRMD